MEEWEKHYLKLLADSVREHDRRYPDRPAIKSTIIGNDPEWSGRC